MGEHSITEMMILIKAGFVKKKMRGEFFTSQIYQERRRADTAPPARTLETNVPGPSIQELAAGARPSDAQMGHRVDLPEAIREKMESSFGADFSNVKLYESQTVADAGAQEREGRETRVTKETGTALPITVLGDA